MLNSKYQIVNSKSASFPIANQITHPANSIRATRIEYPESFRLASSLFDFCRESSTNSPFFVQTNPISQTAKINANPFSQTTYENMCPFGRPKTNPKQTQTKPKQTQFFAPQGPSKPKRTQTNPKQTQFLACQGPPKPKRTQTNPIYRGGACLPRRSRIGPNFKRRTYSSTTPAPDAPTLQLASAEFAVSLIHAQGSPIPIIGDAFLLTEPAFLCIIHVPRTSS